MNLWINALLYQLTWLAAVIGAAHGYGWPGLAMLVVFAAWQLPRSSTRTIDIELMLIAAAVGFIIDSAMAQSGLLVYAAASTGAKLAPLWILAMWMSFSLTLNHSLAYLKTRPLIAAVLGGIGAPLAYWVAGRSWEVINFSANPARALIVIGAVWALVTPLLCALSNILIKRQSSPTVIALRAH